MAAASSRVARSVGDAPSTSDAVGRCLHAHPGGVIAERVDHRNACAGREALVSSMQWPCSHPSALRPDSCCPIICISASWSTRTSLPPPLLLKFFLGVVSP